MHYEFNNRIAAQRTILRLVNRKSFGTEQLFGLSSKAIDRWVSVNHIEPSARIVNLVRQASSKLFFLANKSQQQISEEYSIVQAEIAATRDEIERELQALSSS
jgi:hypothetical protein